MKGRCVVFCITRNKCNKSNCKVFYVKHNVKKSNWNWFCVTCKRKKAWTITKLFKLHANEKNAQVVSRLAELRTIAKSFIFRLKKNYKGFKKDL